jgi:succinate dehydrogenase hydrophobic anchor subunit
MKTKAIMWFIFSATATFCAFFLPGIFWTSIIAAKYHIKNLPTTYPNTLIFFWFLVLLLFSALFHTLYRIPVFISDLGFSKRAVLISKIICTVLFFAVTCPLIWILTR